MREQNREASEVTLGRKVLLALTVGVLGALGVAFGGGLMVGRRAATLDAPPPKDALAQIDADRRFHEELTFYNKLTEPTRPDVGGPREAVAREQLGLPLVAVPTPEVEPEAEPTEAPQAKPITVEAPQAVPEPEPELVTPQPEEPAALTHTAEYTVQVSAFESFDEAQAYSASLRRKGFAPFVVSANVPGKGTWHRVRLGRFASEADAAESKRELARADIPGWVVKAE